MLFSNKVWGRDQRQTCLHSMFTHIHIYMHIIHYLVTDTILLTGYWRRIYWLYYILHDHSIHAQVYFVLIFPLALLLLLLLLPLYTGRLWLDYYSPYEPAIYRLIILYIYILFNMYIPMKEKLLLYYICILWRRLHTLSLYIYIYMKKYMHLWYIYMYRPLKL